MYQVIDYYEPVNIKTEDCLQQGYFWWSCPFYIFDKPAVMRFWKDRPTEQMNLMSFDPTRESVDKKSGTQPGEFLAIAKFKKRPVIILSTAGTTYRDRAWRGGEYYLVAPIRTLRNDYTGEYKANPEFVWDTITYKYSSVFYLPGEPGFDFQESIIQFDRIITLHRSWLLETRIAKLTQEAKVCVNAWIQNYLFGKLPKTFNENLEAYRAMVGEDPKIRASLYGKKGVV